jgi:hypothetical protein
MVNSPLSMVGLWLNENVKLDESQWSLFFFYHIVIHLPISNILFLESTINDQRLTIYDGIVDS